MIAQSWDVGVIDRIIMMMQKQQRIVVIVVVIATYVADMFRSDNDYR